MRGSIYRVQEDFLDRFVERKEYEVSGLNPKYDIIDKIADLEANWTSYCKIGDDVFWKMNDDIPAKMLHQSRALPSDSVYRRDMGYWNLKDNIKG